MTKKSTLVTFVSGTVLVSILGVTPAFAANYPVPNPSTGVLLETTDLVIPSSPDDFRVGAADEDDDHLLGGVDNCEIRAYNRHVYDTQSIEVTVEGTYTFRGVATSTNASGYYPEIYDAMYNFGLPNTISPIEDPMIAIYEGGFDPANPDNNVIGCNDDSSESWDVVNANDGGSDPYWVDYSANGGGWVFGTDDITINGNPVSVKLPHFQATLEPGKYTILITVWDAVSTSDWEEGSTEDLDWTPGSASLTTEIWGPASGATLSNQPWAVNEDLAPTGANDGILGSLILGALVAAGGFALRRRSA